MVVSATKKTPRSTVSFSRRKIAAPFEHGKPRLNTRHNLNAAERNKREKREKERRKTPAKEEEEEKALHQPFPLPLFLPLSFRDRHAAARSGRPLQRKSAKGAGASEAQEARARATYALVGVKVVREARVVLLDNEARGLLDGLCADLAHGDGVG